MSDKRKVSILSLYEVMVTALNASDKNKYSWLLSKCVTQGSLSSTERKSLGIYPMTLNTIKRYADLYISGGFKQLDKLRKQLKTFQTSSNRASLKPRLSISDYKKRLAEAERMRAVLIRAYNDLNSIALDAIASSPQYVYDYERHNKLYCNYFGLSLVEDDE
ncbi:hypothetical protein OS175_07530 [Marinicella sp. S1101]|uniref:hypothetical protein n=1 Tax=Marinicella marina TaxID=2996016 RepID=UPI002260E45C|nr:hypothetical protein [Marinicella marina]MCX7553725.1 hypothetical protein [Marinicella marina]